MRGLSLTSFVILVYGNAQGWVKATKGLRQEDPLSPFLFTIAVDVLSRIMLILEDNDLSEGFIVVKDRPSSPFTICR